MTTKHESSAKSKYAGHGTKEQGVPEWLRDVQEQPEKYPTQADRYKRFLRDVREHPERDPGLKLSGKPADTLMADEKD